MVEKLNRMDQPRKRGGKWKPQDITNVLRNERPTGNSLLNSRYVVDPINKKTKYNRGEQSRYYVENSREGIVSQELFDAM
ncbi:MAG TPA: recombinase family protein [Fervidobacterium sp.]|nr:recombinase family protein [Fervidobacterium sp.]